MQNVIQHSSGNVNVYVNEINGNCQCGFQHTRLINCQIFYINSVKMGALVVTVNKKSFC